MKRACYAYQLDEIQLTSSPPSAINNVKIYFNGIIVSKKHFAIL